MDMSEQQVRKCVGSVQKGAPYGLIPVRRPLSRVVVSPARHQPRAASVRRGTVSAVSESVVLGGTRAPYFCTTDEMQSKPSHSFDREIAVNLENSGLREADCRALESAELNRRLSCKTVHENFEIV